MSNLIISDLFIYKWRYWIGYGFVGISLICILIFAGFYLPGGISEQEVQSVVISNSIDYSNPQSLAIANLPYHMLQNLIINIFGVSIISIKLPSIILAFLFAVGTIVLLRRWFKPRIGVLASAIAITTGQFIFIAQDGTPNIMYLFWAVWLILIADLVAREQKNKTFLIMAFCVTAILSLYTPLSSYIIVALFLSILLHPHLRYIIKQLSKPIIIAAIAISILLLSPLLVAIYKSPGLGLELFGIPNVWPNITDNISLLGGQYLGFFQPAGTTLMTPFFELGSMIIILMGLHRTYKNRAAVKSYITTIWIICIIPLVILNPYQTSITFLPLVLLLASGIGSLLSYWYTLFPRNPYARIGGLVPIVILVSVLLLSGMDRYVYGYRYDPSIVNNFSYDLKLLPKDAQNLVVSDSELAFYNVVAKHNNITVSNKPNGDAFWATRDAERKYSDYFIEKIITSTNSEQSDRFYLYKKI